MKGTDTVESSLLPDQSGSIPESDILTMGSLFAGIGGFELGFEATGRIKTEWQVEKDDYAQRVLAKHWPDVYRHDDVCTFPTPQAKPVDIITLGFPCQDISFSGEGAGLNGKRSGLFFEAIRIIREMGCRYAVVENVPALLNRGMGEVLASLSESGFDAEWSVVSARSMGSPQMRKRLFVIAYLSDSSSSRSTTRLPAPTQRCKRDTGVTDNCGDQSCWRQGESHWSIEPDVDRLVDGFRDRACQLRCLGNAVVPQVAQVVAERLLEIHDARCVNFLSEKE